MRFKWGKWHPDFLIKEQLGGQPEYLGWGWVKTLIFFPLLWQVPQSPEFQKGHQQAQGKSEQLSMITADKYLSLEKDQDLECKNIIINR